MSAALASTLLLASAIVLAACDFSASKKHAGAPTCENRRDYADAVQPFHTVAVDGRDDFAPEAEAFPTSTPGYVARATWDECTLFLGWSGPAFADEGCEGEACGAGERGRSPYRYLVLYLDTDPLGGQGTESAEELGGQDWSLPFRANYLILVRTDTRPVPPDGSRTRRSEAPMENVQVFQWTKTWSSTLRREWDAIQPTMARVAVDPAAGFAELAIDLKAFGSPCAVQAVGWMVDTEMETGFAFWPADAMRAAAPRRRSSSSGGGASASSVEASGRGSSTDARTSTGDSTPRDSAARRATVGAEPAPSDTNAVTREAQPVPLRRRWGFELAGRVVPNDAANLDRISYARVGRCAEGPS